VGWKKDGTMIIMAVSGKPRTTGEAVGGATNAQVGIYLKRLGAVDGSKLDGGGSTTMFVRFHPGGALHRVDQPQKAPLRKVSNAFGVELP
jgi:exopolysaccharide biosynthesis protein